MSAHDYHGASRLQVSALSTPVLALRGSWDGGVRSGHAPIGGCGWMIEAVNSFGGTRKDWFVVQTGFVSLKNSLEASNAFEAELYGSEFLSAGLKVFFDVKLHSQTLVERKLSLLLPLSAPLHFSGPSGF